MDRRNLRIISTALMNARDIIEIAAKPEGKFVYGDFADAQLRDMFYAINDMCIELNKKINNQ